MLCKRNHYYHEWEVCPFCCALDNIEPMISDKAFLMIYNQAKGKTEEELIQLCESLNWPEEDLTDSKSRFF